MANNLEHYWFLKYSIATKKFLEKVLYLKKYPEDKNVSIYYTTPARAFVKFIVPVINGSNLNPTVTYHLTSHIPKQGETPGGYFKKYQQSKDNTKVWETISHPLVYSLTFRVTVWTTRQSDMDVLMYQAMTAAPFNHKYSCQVDGQWAELEVRNITSENNMEPGEAQDVSVRYGFEIVIPRAYLPLNYEEYYGTIEDTDVVFDV